MSNYHEIFNRVELSASMPSRIKIEPYAPKHIEVFDLMILPEYDKFFYEGDIKLFKSRLKVFAKSLSLSGSGTGVVATDNGKAIGFATSISSKHFLMIAIHPDYAGKGVGKILLGLVIEKLHQQGITNILARTKKINLPMQGILGTVGTIVEDDPDGENDDSYLYQIESNPLTKKELIQFKSTLEKMSTPK